MLNLIPPITYEYHCLVCSSSSILGSRNMDILNDFCKIKRQLFRQENIFGYNTALANQLYAFYCILGTERYFTDQFHFSTKVFFFIWHFAGLIIPFVIFYKYDLFFEKNDLILLLHVLFAIVSCFFYRAFVPLLLYWYGDDFKRIMKDADSKIWDERSILSKLKNPIDIKSVAMKNVIFFCSFLSVFTLITTFDVLVFYDEKKVKDYSYYVFPLPNVEKNGNIWIFLTVSGSAIITDVGFISEVCVLCGILSY